MLAVATKLSLSKHFTSQKSIFFTLRELEKISYNWSILNADLLLWIRIIVEALNLAIIPRCRLTSFFYTST